MKLYRYWLWMAVLLCFQGTIWGYVLPYLFSMKSDEGPLIGILVAAIIATPTTLYTFEYCRTLISTQWVRYFK